MCLDGSDETDTTVDVFRLDTLPTPDTVEDRDGRIDEVLQKGKLRKALYDGVGVR